MNKIKITTPTDFHLHIRNGEIMKTVIQHTASQFGSALIMPNLKPPITNLNLAKEYLKEIKDALPTDSTFKPLMSLFFTQNLTGKEVKEAYDSGIVNAIKLFPYGATTNSEFGVTNYDGIQETLETMAEIGIPLLFHGEVTDPNVDIFDREVRFIYDILEPLRKKNPTLKIVMEHLTTKEAVDYISESDKYLGATITAHHLHLNRNSIFQGGLNPHNYCLPIIKKESDREALVKVATSGNSKFFLGTDSAPHLKSAKETFGGAGIYSAHTALPLYAEIFERENALDNLEKFASFNGADFYGIERNKGTVELIKEENTIPEIIYNSNKSIEIVPLMAGKKINWKMVK